jgi:predicted ATPase
MLARLERPSEHWTPPRAGERVSPKTAPDIPFVGRDEELARLMAFARELGSEQGATILIDGVAGIGKTRLVDEFIARARATTPMLILRSRERLGGSAVPYAGVADALRAAIRAPGVAGASQHLLAEAARILPELRDNFTLPAAGPIDDEAARLRFFEGVAAFVDAVAYEQPVCIVIDDLQHASAATTDLLTYLSARLQQSPVLLLLIARD